MLLGVRNFPGDCKATLSPHSKSSCLCTGQCCLAETKNMQKVHQ